MDKQLLAKELDRTVAKSFLGKNASFLGSIVCSMNIKWDDTIRTACTDGVSIWWNPNWFISLTPNEREFVLIHELWHPARLHFQRAGSRDWNTWAKACDYVINQEMKKDGYSFGSLGSTLLYDSRFEGLSEEDIYDILIKENKDQNDDDELPDMVRPSSENLRQSLNNVVQAVQQAIVAGSAGSIPGSVKALVDSFLRSTVPWQSLLHRFLEDLDEEDYSWQRPNRRYQDIYLPTRVKEANRLTTLNYYLDVSGSIDESQLLRFNSEVRHIKEKYNPQQLKIVQFDYKIQQVDVIKEEDCFEKLNVIGRGGTHLECVRKHIIKDKPSAAIIFTDLECEPMRELPVNIPIIWIVVNNPMATVPYGTIAHVKT